MSLRVLTLDDSDEWDGIVRTFKNYDVYWLSGYVKAFKIHGDGEPLLFFFEDEDIRGINVVMKRDISSDPFFAEKIEKEKNWDFSTPYGYGGWLLEGDKSEKLFEEYVRWCRKEGIISEFVRFHPLVQNHEFCTEDYEVIGLGTTVTMDITSSEKIWANFTSKNRNKIRKAQKGELKIYCGRYPEIFKTFRSIYNLTMDRDNANKYYYFGEEFYSSILDDLPDNALVFYVVFEEKIIAISIILMANGRMNYHLSGSLKEYAEFASTSLMLYSVALWGMDKGYKTLYLGGGLGSNEDNLYRFKKAFNRNDDFKRFYIGKKVFLQEKYDELCSMKEIDNNGFFPGYRA
jgi:hypothetical protein